MPFPSLNPISETTLPPVGVLVEIYTTMEGGRYEVALIEKSKRIIGQLYWKTAQGWYPVDVEWIAGWREIVELP